MPDVLKIKGQKGTEAIYDNEQFARLLDDRLGEDAALYFREHTDPDLLKEEMALTDEEILKDGWCSGECDKVQRTQEHYESILKEAGEIAQEIYDKILEGYKVGGRRTKKEQFAIEKAIVIMRLAKKNT